MAEPAPEPSSRERMLMVTIGDTTYEADLSADFTVCISMGGAVGAAGPIPGIDGASIDGELGVGVSSTLGLAAALGVSPAGYVASLTPFLDGAHRGHPLPCVGAARWHVQRRVRQSYPSPDSGLASRIA